MNNKIFSGGTGASGAAGFRASGEIQVPVRSRWGGFKLDCVEDRLHS